MEDKLTDIGTAILSWLFLGLFVYTLVRLFI
jgi:hypothetical protein